jgi:hypothetical protein
MGITAKTKIFRNAPPVIAIALQRRTSHLEGPSHPVGIPLFGG